MSHRSQERGSEHSTEMHDCIAKDRSDEKNGDGQPAELSCALALSHRPVAALAASHAHQRVLVARRSEVHRSRHARSALGVETGSVLRTGGVLSPASRVP